MWWFPPPIFNLPNIAPVTIPQADRPMWLFWLLMGPCAAGWLTAYGLAIYRTHIDKRVGIPVLVVGVNFAWELTLSLVLAQATVQRPINFSWMLLDIFILWQTMRYGWKDYPEISRRNFRLLVLGIIIWTGIFVIMTTYELNDTTGIYTGTAVNVFLSLSFILMLKRRGSSAGQSLYIATAKGIGSFFAGWTVMVMFPGHNLFILLFLTVWSLDLVYIVMLYQRIRAESQSPWTWNRPRVSELESPDRKLVTDSQTQNLPQSTAIV